MPLCAISGSQGTGKSTLLSALKLPTIERKTSRSILSDWQVTLSEVNNKRAMTVLFQDEILKRKMADEADAINSDSYVFTERTYADLFVYALVAVGKDNEYSNWLDEYYERCLIAQKASYNNSYVFYLRAGHFQPVEDGVRGTNRHYSFMSDSMMRHYTKQMSPLNFREISVSNLDYRVEYIRRTLDPDSFE